MKDRILKYRKENGWTQDEFGRLLRVKQATISKLERGASISKTIATRLHQLDPKCFPLDKIFGIGQREGETRNPATAACREAGGEATQDDGVIDGEIEQEQAA